MNLTEDQDQLDQLTLEAPPSVPPVAPRQGQLRILLVTLSIGLLLGAGVCELTLRILNKPKAEPVKAGWRYVPEKGNSHFNQLHLRGREIACVDSSRVVLLVGDSQVQGMGCVDDSMPENLLESSLRMRDPRFSVFSVAAAGWGNDQEYLALKEYFQHYRADAVLLWETFDNDVWNNVFPTNVPRDGAPKPTFWLEKGRFSGPNYPMDAVVYPAPSLKLKALYRRFFPLRWELDEEWEKKLPSPYRPLTAYEGPYKSDWDSVHSKAKHLNLSIENLGTEKSHFSVFLEPRSPRMQYGLDLTHAILDSIGALCRSHACRFLVFYFEPKVSPYYGIEDSVVVQKVGDKFYRASIAQFTLNRDYANRGFRTLGLPLVAENWKLSPTDRHLNQKANQILMATLADSLLREPGFLPAGR